MQCNLPVFRCENEINYDILLCNSKVTPLARRYDGTREACRALEGSVRSVGKYASVGLACSEEDLLANEPADEAESSFFLRLRLDMALSTFGFSGEAPI